ARPRRGLLCWAFGPVVLLTAVVALFRAAGGSITGLIGDSPPSADEFDIRRVEFHPGEIHIRVTNPQRDDLTIASVTVDEAIVPSDGDGPPIPPRRRPSRRAEPH